MDHEIQEALRAVRRAVANRSARNLASKPKVAQLRELDEAVCLTSRVLYMRFLSTALWCRSVEEATLEAVREALEDAVSCLPEHEYGPARSKSIYKVRTSVVDRLKEFEGLARKMVHDHSRTGWLSIPIRKADEVLEPA